ncbi:MAG: ABC transporter permease, partial [Gemmatimonadota bacterium]|nr:ABC transporter permease [Gemmatimonadota bacterium]
MRIYKWLAMGMRELARKSSVAAEAEDEMRFHIEMETEKNRRAGLAPDEAHRSALLAFGGVAQHKEAMRDEQTGRVLERVAQDVRFALRQLRKTPGFTIAAVLTLAVGIGGNTAVFSAVNGVLLRPLPYPDPDRLVTIAHSTKGGQLPKSLPSSSATNVVYAWATRSFEAIALYEFGKVNLTGGDVPERVGVVRATSNLFAVLRASPVLGRPFSKEEDQPGASPVAVISHGLWMSRFAGDRAIVGKSFIVDGVACVVVGVMPDGFTFPYDHVEMWLPMRVDLRDLGGFHTPSIARLRPGVRAEDAQRELTALLPRVSTVVDFLTPTLLHNAGIHPDVHPYADDVVGSVRLALWTLWATVALVLLIACVNVASLLVVRAESRQGEMALRSALGAESRHLLAQSLTESTLLIALGSTVGVGLAQIALAMLRRLGAGVLPRLDEAHIDGTILVITALIAGGAAVLFALIPVARYRGATSGLVFGVGERGATGGRGARRVRDSLVVAQVAMAAMLLVASGLMIRSFQQLARVEIGIQPDNVLTFRIALPSASYRTPADVARFHTTLLQRIRALPDVRAAGATGELPLTGGAPADPLRVDGIVVGAKTLPPLAEMRMATPGYFEAMGIPMRAGRAIRIDDSERQTGAVVITEAIVRSGMAGRDPIGARVAHGLEGVRGERPWSEVVGVAGDVRGLSLEEAPLGAVYCPMVNKPGVEMEWIARFMVYAVKVRS